MNLLFLGTLEDKPYLPRLKGLVGTASIAGSLAPIDSLYEVTKTCKSRNITSVITTNPTLLHKLVGDIGSSGRKKPSIDNYAGSYFLKDGIEFVILNPLPQLVSVPYGEFLTRRYISKLTNPAAWPAVSTFNWRIADAHNLEQIYALYKDAYLIAIDIETFSTPPSIRCVGYTAIFTDGTSHSCVLPIDSTFALAWLRKLNSLPAPKVFQNGKYDIAYLSMYDAVPYNYIWDTAHLFHSWYSELPKDLGFLQAFSVREAAYWKDLAQTNDLHEYYLYNAKDTWATAHVFLNLMAEAPQFALSNYMNEFPLVFPCHLAEMTGIARDMDELTLAQKEQDTVIKQQSASLDKMLSTTGFNVSSPIQMKQLLKVLGCGDLESADEKNLKKASLRHPLNSRIINSILAVRKARKLVSTYLTPGKEYHGTGGTDGNRKPRILYSLNPHGTDTGRLASKEHHFWCGLQVQNIPRGTAVKRTLIADDGFRIAECDLEQAESRDTAHIAGDDNLIIAVSGERDFHSVNASAFFGVPYSSIFDQSTRKTIDKALRDLAKRVNHGANYNMGAGVLVETMGEDKVYAAARILKLPKLWSLKQIAEHLLAQFHKTYPAISRIYYPGVIHEIITTKMLTSKATHEVLYQASKAGLVRYCFDDPSKSKSALNAYVAHPPQSLNAMTLNKAFMKVFYEIAINPEHSNNFKLLAQIHDSILFQFRVGHEYLIDKVNSAMEIPVTIKAYDEKTRTFTVPAAAKAGKDGKGSYRWSETE